VQISIWSEGSEDLRVFRPRAGRCVVAGLSPGRWEFAAHRVGLEPRSEGALQVFDGQDVLDIELPLLWEALEEP
jgi:hypothetical protein